MQRSRPSTQSIENLTNDASLDELELAHHRQRRSLRKLRSRATNGPAWPQPKPVPDGLLPVKAFDRAFLPEAIAPWVMDISDRMQCPPEYVGIPAMIELGSVIGRKVAIHPQRKTDWVEVANLWGCIVGRPGAMKSPADGMVQRFSLLVWPDQSPEWREYDRYPNSKARIAAWETFERLNKLHPDTAGATIDKFGGIPYRTSANGDLI